MGSFLLQISIFMSLLGSKVDLHHRYGQLENQTLSRFIIWGYLAIQICFLIASLFFMG